MPDRPASSPLRVYSDPLQHALIAAAVAAPLVPRAGGRVVATAVGAALLIDVDHAIAARSLRVRDTTALAVRPWTHSLLTAVGTGGIVAAAAGPLHGWAAFAGLVSHLLHDAGDDAAPTPLLWPVSPARQLGRRPQLAGTALLVLASAAVSRAAAAASQDRSSADGGGDGGAAARPRTA
jgi:membrane-bound metal-dependent hydrolase YbcI (DUF457 family)